MPIRVYSWRIPLPFSVDFSPKYVKIPPKMEQRGIMRKSQLITTPAQTSSREMTLPAYKVGISPGPPLSHTTPANSANLPAVCLAGRLNPQESDCPESENVRRITYEFISKLCKTNPISKTAKINANPVPTKDYENTTPSAGPKNEPKRTQTNPKRTQFLARQRPPKPKRTQTNPISGAANAVAFHH